MERLWRGVLLSLYFIAPNHLILEPLLAYICLGLWLSNNPSISRIVQYFLIDRCPSTVRQACIYEILYIRPHSLVTIHRLLCHLDWNMFLFPFRRSISLRIVWILPIQTSVSWPDYMIILNFYLFLTFLFLGWVSGLTSGRSSKSWLLLWLGRHLLI